MIPQEIASQLPPDLPASEVKSVRLSASPASSLGESYLLAARGQLRLFIRDSLLSPLVEVKLQGAPRLLEESFDACFCATQASGEELKIKVSSLEKDAVQELLAQASGEGARVIEAELVDLIKRAEREAPTISPPNPAAALSPEALEAQQQTLDEEAAEAITNGDLETAKQRLVTLCALPLPEEDDRDEYRKGLASIEALQRENPREAFFLAGDYDSFYCEYQYELAFHLGKALEPRGEKVLAAAAFAASLEEDDAARLLTELQLSESQLRQRVLQEAIPFLQTRLEQHPTDDLALSFLASIFYEEDRDEEALRLSHQLIALAPQRSDGYRQAVNAALSLKRLEEAAQLAQLALQKYPKAPWAHTLRGEVAEAQSDPAQSRAAFEEALRLDPGDLGAIDGLQKILRSQREHKALAAHLEASLEHLSYKEDQVFEELAQLYEGPLKHPQKAKEFRRRAKESDTLSAAEPAPEGSRWPALGLVALALLVLWLILLR